MSRLVILATSAVLVVSVVVVHHVWGLPAAILLLAAAALSSVVLLIWSSLAQLDSEEPLTFEEALSLAAPTAAEEQKRAVLRALKDLDYELRVGKITRADYDTVSAQYRQEAKRMIAAADSSLASGSKRAESLSADYLAHHLPEELKGWAPASQRPTPSSPRSALQDAPTEKRTQEPGTTDQNEDQP